MDKREERGALRTEAGTRQGGSLDRGIESQLVVSGHDLKNPAFTLWSPEDVLGYGILQLGHSLAKGANQMAEGIVDQQATGIPIDGGYPYNISIEKVLNGYIVKVGCKRVVFESLDKLLIELSRYYRNTAEVTKEYLSKPQ